MEVDYSSHLSSTVDIGLAARKRPCGQSAVLRTVVIASGMSVKQWGNYGSFGSVPYAESF